LLSLSLYGQKPEEQTALKSRFGFDVLRRPPLLQSVYINYTGDNWDPEILTAISIQNDALQFEKTGEDYQSRFQITLAVLKDKQTLLSETYNREVILKDFAATNAKDKAQYQDYRLCLPGDLSAKRGSFELFLEIRDMVSQKSFTQKQPIEISSPEKTFFIVPPVFLLRLPRQDDSLLHISPLQKQLDYNADVTVYTKFRSADSGRILANLRLFEADKENDRLCYQLFDTLDVTGDSGEMTVNIPLSRFAEGSYRLRIFLQQGEHKTEADKEFSIVWFEKPTYLYKPDLALRPMRYLLTDEQYNLAEKKNMRDLGAWMKQYWKDHDPTPDTDYNELMSEYYQRVQEANVKFNLRFKEGWETDQGKIFLLYGEPSSIEDHKLATTTAPYQVWHYPDSTKFVFVDKDRNDEFELVKDEEGN